MYLNQKRKLQSPALQLVYDIVLCITHSALLDKNAKQHRLVRSTELRKITHWALRCQCGVYNISSAHMFVMTFIESILQRLGCSDCLLPLCNIMAPRFLSLCRYGIQNFSNQNHNDRSFILVSSFINALFMFVAT